MSDDRLALRALASRAQWAWGAATLAAVLVSAIVVFVTQPENRWAVLVFIPLAVIFFAFLLVRRNWVETSTGTVVHRSLLSTRRIPLGEADKLELVNNRGGALLLRVRRPGGRFSTYLPILALSDYVKRSQPPATLVALAEQIETWAPQRRTVAKQLRRQAEHLEKGGTAEDSPLAGLITHGVMTAAKAGGAAGGSSLLD